MRWFSPPGTTGLAAFQDPISLIYPVTYFALVVLFTYFYTGVVFSSKDIAERLQRQGGFIEGRRPGLETQKYLSQVVNRLNLFGSVSLGFLALTPVLAQAFLRTDQLAIGGDQYPHLGGRLARNPASNRVEGPDGYLRRSGRGQASRSIRPGSWPSSSLASSLASCPPLAWFEIVHPCATMTGEASTSKQRPFE